MDRNEMIWVSLDGGGTKTELCACDSQGKMLYDQFFSRSNYKTAGVEEVSKTLSQAVSAMLDTLERSMEDVAGMVLAIAGCDTIRDVEIYTEIMLAAGVPGEKLLICNDTEVIFRALSDREGICVVAGTGSIVCAYDGEKMSARVGGWGAPLSDLGSGYWIGAKILKRMIRWLDSMEEEERPVFKEIEARFSREDAELAWVLADLSVTEVASVSALVFSHAAEGDELCQTIIRRAAELLVEQIVAVYKKAGLPQEFSMVTVGGLFSDEGFAGQVEAGVRDALKTVKLDFIKPVGSPAEDGLKYARKIFAAVKAERDKELSEHT